MTRIYACTGMDYLGRDQRRVYELVKYTGVSKNVVKSASKEELLKMEKQGLEKKQKEIASRLKEIELIEGKNVSS